jgi:uncharacterized protein (DUF488 family)
MFYTIGFTKKPASKFFKLLKESGAKRIVDVRLNNSSQLAGFAKRDDLAYFLESVCDIEYVHLPILAPTKELLDEYRKGGGDWDRYEQRFLNLMRERKIENEVPRDVIEDGCLLCSEAEPHRCHRRLVGEYLQEHWGAEMEMRHLK